MECCKPLYCMCDDCRGRFLKEHIVVAAPKKDNYHIVRDCVQIGEEFTTEDIYLKVGDVLGFKDRRTTIEHINRYLNSWEKHRVMERAERNRKGDGHRTHYTLWRRVM